MLDPRFVERMKNLLGEKGFEEYEKELEKECKRAFRINPAKKPDTLPFDTEPVPYCENGYYFDYDRIGQHPLHHAGAFYVQEPAAMVPVASIDIAPGFKILDTCASPGGKSTQAASFLSEKGFIISNEISPQRARILSGNFERLGLKNAVVTSCDVETLTRDFVDFFDLVIVDAPCSGEGMFRKEPDALKDWSPENIQTCAMRQRDIIEKASRAVAGGGYLLYSTCTFAKEENEDVVNFFLEKHPEFTLVSPNPRIIPFTVSGIGDERMRRFYPHIAPGEGQFTALMKKEEGERGEYRGKSALSPLTKEERMECERFLDDTLISYNKDFLFKFKDNVVYIDPEIPVPEKISYSAGVTVGEVKKGYIQPHHSLFSAMGGAFKRRIDLPADDKRLLAYLRGESIFADCDNGYVVITASGVPVGGGKAVNGQIKNHYPKGLRLLH
ncbi:MAG: hypothetical protein IJ323_02550 [Clostridia bacterium]|nr:hypothetical protein [Clostridia bacterium]